MFQSVFTSSFLPCMHRRSVTRPNITTILTVTEIRLSFIMKCEVARIFPNEMPNGAKIHIWVKQLENEQKKKTIQKHNHQMTEAKEKRENAIWHAAKLTVLLQNNSILSSGGICDPSELLSFWFDCELFVIIVLTPDSEPNILSSTCSQTFRHCRNSFATNRSYEMTHY